MNTGYIFNKLRLTGNAVVPAEIIFQLGANIITGPSNTGKTFIFQCLNYMLGSSKTPKRINEVKNYSSIFLQITTKDSKVLTLESDLKGGDFHLYESSIDDITFDQEYEILARKHNPKSEQTISAFLLKLNNSYPKKIRTDQKGKTRQLSYRDVAGFLMIHEERIITENSIIQTHYTKATPEKNTLKYFVTGEDDSDIIAALSKTEVTNKKGRLELLKELIVDESEELKNMQVEWDREPIDSLSTRIEELNSSYKVLDEKYNDLTKKRHETQVIIEETLVKKRVIEELYQRSNILNNHYNTDISRLKSTIEASVLLQDDAQGDSVCPLCKNKLPHNCSDTDITGVINACNAEIGKIEGLLIELVESEKSMFLQLKDFDENLANFEIQKQNLEYELENKLKLDIDNISQTIESLIDKKSFLLGIEFKQKRLEKYSIQKDSLEELVSKSNKNNGYESLSTANMTPLSNYIELVLKGCNYPDLTAVSYSEEGNDFVISGEDRSLFGKGYRAIIYSAFIVAIQELVSAKDYSIGIPILDSPLVTFKKPDLSEEDLLPIDLAMDFYRYVSDNSNIDQIIIIENVEPPSDILNKINHITFTQSTKEGRYGFIPMNNMEHFE
ncbi:hypothetical protein [Zobellia laminariae]|uniref:hypothetical protein n=1 Tax=Zobellia laminariae TaxID=248906 RepID=UPI0026F45270|nr:hypothetical protein [Zobellia laminariae]WKX76948.1 hypothetical protein Q5W13_01930 [Zobellia laminariae]